MRSVEFFVDGVPIPQGSKSARVVRGRAILTEGFGERPKRHKAWRKAVSDAAETWLSKHGDMPPYDGPVCIDLTFYLPRPKSTSKRITTAHRKPDLSKIVRAVEDSLTGIIYTDDARIIEIVAKKQYADDNPPGVLVRLWGV